MGAAPISLAGGVILGGLMGFLVRPSVPLVGQQLPFMDVITRGSNLEGMDRMLLIGIAETSFNYLIVGAIVGGAIGLGAAYLVSMRKYHEAKSGASQATPHPDVSESIKKLAELKDKGFLNAEEFEAKKKELLGRL